MESMFLPPVYDWLWTVVALAVAAAMFAAIVQINRSTLLSSSARVVWTLAVLLLPALGAIAWFLARPREVSRTEG